MRVAILSSEVVPYAKTGGLADVAGALPKALGGQGANAILIMPFYEQVKRDLIQNKALDDLYADWRGSSYRCNVFYSEACGAPTYLIDAPEFFQRNSIYGFRDDHYRFAFFNRAALALMKRLGDPPDVVHLNDWHCGFAAVELQSRRKWDSFFSRTRSLISIHNMAYQGVFGENELWKLGFGYDHERNYFLSNGAASALKAGLMASDMLSAVSRRYGYEIQSAEHGHGLEWITRMRHERLIGITNGVDYDEWNPQTDKHLNAHYNNDDLTGKRYCKLDLLRKFSLPEELDRPIIGVVSRLTPQKGYDLIKEAAYKILETGAFLIMLGSGAEEYENFMQRFRDYAPHRVGVYKGFNEPLAHQIEAGADLFLMPSLYEPCGLNQMYSLRYGTVPVVRATGGLDDTIEQFDRFNGTGNGFKFGPYNAGVMMEKIYEALFCYAEPDVWRRIQWNGMNIDNSWANAARKYIALYETTMRT